MKVTKAELEAIAKTLPIGYYTKRPIPVTIDSEAETSYYTPLEDKICISLSQIATAMEKVPDTADKETTVRSNLYHEVSHAILTPTNLEINDPMNIFEDERIETLLRDFYLDVDFEADKYHMNGLEIGEVPPAHNALNAFYNLVRFHSGKEEFLDEVDSIIDKYKNLNRETDDYCGIHRYQNEVEDLFNELCEDFGENPDDYKNPPQQNGTSGTPMSGDGDEETDGESADGEESDEEQKKNGKMKCGKPGHGISSTSATKIAIDAFGNVSQPQINKDIYDKFSMILENYKKKNGGGSSIRAYSGVLNPRSIARNDYKIFDRSSCVRGGNSYGSLHLNLFIDRSGSFWRSQDIVNELLRTLTLIEKKNPNFTMDVVFCGEGQRIVEKVKDRVLECMGGNDLDDSIYKIFRGLQKKQTYNYNIALFDGDAYSDTPRGHSRDTFRAFDSNNTTIISNDENQRYIDRVVHSARVVYTDRYTDELLKNVSQALEQAFR